jgi:class III poly(R)-hydroxyalkanoic acid synthase PhaE subunit
MDASRGYFTLAEQLMSGVAGGGREVGMEAVNGWLENMQKMWSSPTPNLFGANNPGKGFNTFWDLPMDTWQRLAANIVPMPGDFTQAYHQEGAGAVRDQMNRFLSIPAVGYHRESQEQFQSLAQRQIDYATATQAYHMAFGKLGAETARKFQEALQARAAENKPISSLRELYDQWVEMSEAAYAEFVMTREYQQLYGQLVNSLLALKQQMARMVDQHLEAMHMPTHAEISTLQCRQQELRRDNLRLRKEIKEIHKQLEALRKASITPEPAAAPPAPAKRVTPTRARKAGDAK